MRGDMGAATASVESVVFEQLTRTSNVLRCISKEVTNRFEESGQTHKEVPDGTSMHSNSSLVARTTLFWIIPKA